MPGLYAPITASALFRHLDRLGRPDLLAKVGDFRARLDVYLRAVNATFSHYTSHAVDHSDQIVRELSNLLFPDRDDAEPSYALNAVETYLLLLAAYAHDSGMVVTETEKFRALGSAEWEEYVERSPIAAVLPGVREELVGDRACLTDGQVQFARGLELRFLLADFFRSQHARRSRLAIASSLRAGPDFLGDDPSAVNTLAAICEGHGLNRAELASPQSYPTRRDLFGEAVNVRFLTIMLRIGDLLDMRNDRACPMLHNLASPMPGSSEVHWTQYQRIVSRVTSPEVIEIRAECETAEEHRLLQDWCQWLVDEVRDSSRLLNRPGQPSIWTPPHVSMGAGETTVEVSRAANARYRVEDWRFALDHDEIVSRLINDVHRHPLGYLRELLQNALDATRARASGDASDEEQYPNLLPEDLRERYAIHVHLPLDASGRVAQVVVADQGVGMTDDLVKNYLLQIGRSWYVSREFRERYRFLPTSRFGVGFLSVFAASADVKVVTRWHEADGDRALSMRLRGPRNYLLFEDDVRGEAGTTVSVSLTEPQQPENVMNYLADLCVGSEFPVIVEVTNADGTANSRSTLPDRVGETAWRIQLSNDVAARLHRIESSTPGVFGFVEFLVLEERGEPDDWATTVEDLDRLAAKLDPTAVIPALPPSWVASNGLASRGGGYPLERSESVRWQLDVRLESMVAEVGLDRRSAPDQWFPEGILSEALDQHLEQVGGSSLYRARVLSKFGRLLDRWRFAVPFVPQISGEHMTVREVLGMDRLRVAFRPGEWGGAWPKLLRDDEIASLGTFESKLADRNPLLAPRTPALIRYAGFYDFADNFTPRHIEILDEGLMVVELERRRTSYGERKRGHIIPFSPRTETVAVETATEHVCFNGSHRFISLLCELPEEFSRARERILGKIVRWYERGESLASMTTSVASATGSGELAWYAEFLRGQSHHGLANSYLRLPVRAENGPPSGQ